MDEVCEQLDELSVKILSVMNDIVVLKCGLESQLHEGWICVAKSRIGMGGTSAVSCLQFDERSCSSAVTVGVDAGGTEFVSSLENYTLPEAAKRDILKRFGILTPTLLRKGQQHFVFCINLVCELATSQTHLQQLCREYRKLLDKKRSLAS